LALKEVNNLTYILEFSSFGVLHLVGDSLSYSDILIFWLGGRGAGGFDITTSLEISN
jgi:hypothetical protein